MMINSFPNGRVHFALLLLTWFAVLHTLALPTRADDKIDFSLQIEPILADRCYKCHGPDEQQRQAGLRLDDESAAKEYAIVPGEPQESELVSRITATDSDRMPPPESKLSLSDGEIRLIQKWVAEGANWKKHWAFQTARRNIPPQNSSDNWSLNEIDRFVLDQMQRHGLSPNPLADRQTLIRRLSFDITGLPPTLDEIDDFLRDQSPEAYEKLVDRLLASPRYGERMASEWLDVARYSDTYGYQVDRDRFVWPWRDWVIRALNDNLPYDEFLTWQIAGDLLPDATDEQILATTFSRLHPQKVEGGSVPEEFRVEYVADRTQTYASAFLGLTLECARCHDHKYDPITQQEYYQLFSYFNNIDEAGLYSFFTNSIPTPTLLLHDGAAKEKLDELDKKIRIEESKLKQVLETEIAALAYGIREEIDRINASSPLPGQIAKIDFEKIDIGENTRAKLPGGETIIKLTGDDEVKLEHGNFRRFEPFSVSLWLRTPDKKTRAVIFHRSRAWTDAASRGYQLLIEDGKLSASLIHFWPGNAIRIKTSELLAINKWTHVCVTYDGSSRADGLRIFVDGNGAECATVRDNLTKQITGGGQDHIAIGARFRDRGFTDGQIHSFKIFDRQLNEHEVLMDFQSQSAMGQEGPRRVQPSHKLNHVIQNSPKYAEQLKRLRDLRQAKCDLLDKTQEIMVMREMDSPRAAYLLNRGHYAMRQSEVTAGVPAVFGHVSTPGRNDRLGLARWTTDPANPLTARVAVNRLWQTIFGHGLVRTPEDFGSQGRRPQNLELLDWLAVDFVENGWDMKRTIKNMVMSATYRQSSDTTAAKREKDPDNLWLSRSPSFRLPAEMIRDNALAVSGLLVNKTGGPPVKPYDLDESFKPMKPDEGEGLYRRSVYTFWKRTGPAPLMMAFDAAKRDVCRLRRERTMSPLQALSLLNSPQFVEAARSLAEKQINKHGSDNQQVIRQIFRSLTSRYPADRELEILVKLFNSQLAYLGDSPSATEEYLSVGHKKPDPEIEARRLAAMTVVGSTLMSYHGCVTRR